MRLHTIASQVWHVLPDELAYRPILEEIRCKIAPVDHDSHFVAVGKGIIIIWWPAGIRSGVSFTFLLVIDQEGEWMLLHQHHCHYQLAGHLQVDLNTINREKDGTSYFTISPLH